MTIHVCDHSMHIYTQRHMLLWEHTYSLSTINLFILIDSFTLSLICWIFSCKWTIVHYIVLHRDGMNKPLLAKILEGWTYGIFTVRHNVQCGYSCYSFGMEKAEEPLRALSFLLILYTLQYEEILIGVTEHLWHELYYGTPYTVIIGFVQFVIRLKSIRYFSLSWLFFMKQIQ